MLHSRFTANKQQLSMAKKWKVTNKKSTMMCQELQFLLWPLEAGSKMTQWSRRDKMLNLTALKSMFTAWNE